MLDVRDFWKDLESGISLQEPSIWFYLSYWWPLRVEPCSAMRLGTFSNSFMSWEDVEQQSDLIARLTIALVLNWASMIVWLYQPLPPNLNTSPQIFEDSEKFLASSMRCHGNRSCISMSSSEGFSWWSSRQARSSNLQAIVAQLTRH